ncbi:FAD:protein FMN transferase [Pseudonocardia hydrocarbonoxydans]|uniref:FAD:protein FMN transferase n=1 Tax=Pseudonocardia hydrocarbonoxydans TaxID=76726 RepID=A0A4Y3WMS6_9PSEU|nr:FAD:protein FMN transferase [Pseudonocardia hydrocarbonoxydans]GEC18626.1 hypothetical protein PHY01_09090 [Pseudonocardia hydrocarbonoxydans]
MSGRLHVEHVMGTAVTVDLRVAGPADRAVAEVVALLHEVDRVFSTWRPDSDVSRLRAGTLALDACHPWVEQVLTLCARRRDLTAGWFDPWAIPGGVDPTGLVKGWAAQRASDVLVAHGFDDHCVNAGGDVRVRGDANPGVDGRPGWQVGVVDPADRTRMLDVLVVRDGAVATSGAYERGTLAVDPHSGRRVEPLRSATVTGPDLAVADALSTAASAAGLDALPWLASLDGFEALVVTRGEAVHTTPGWVGPAGRRPGQGAPGPAPGYRREGRGRSSVVDEPARVAAVHRGDPACVTMTGQAATTRRAARSRIGSCTAVSRTRVGWLRG